MTGQLSFLPGPTRWESVTSRGGQKHISVQTRTVYGRLDSGPLRTKMLEPYLGSNPGCPVSYSLSLVCSDLYESSKTHLSRGSVTVS